MQLFRTSNFNGPQVIMQLCCFEGYIIFCVVCRFLDQPCEAF